MTDKKRTITLTNRRPVVVNEDEWPVIAQAKGDSFVGRDYTRRQQALARNEVDTYSLRVRQHADGRCIVYGVFAGSIWTGHDDCRCGELLDKGADVVAVIRAVGEDCGFPESVIQACIADLPAEEI